MRNIADVGVRRTFATYVDVDRFMLVFNRIAPGPTNALTVAAYSGQKKTIFLVFNQGCAWPKQCAKRSGTWAEDRLVFYRGLRLALAMRLKKKNGLLRAQVFNED